MSTNDLSFIRKHLNAKINGRRQLLKFNKMEAALINGKRIYYQYGVHSVRNLMLALICSLHMRNAFNATIISVQNV